MKSLIISFIILLAGVAAYAQPDLVTVHYLGYQNGVYSVQVTNPQACTMDLNFNYTGTVTGIVPNSAGSLTHEVIGANATVVYQISGSLTALSITPLGLCGTSGGGIPVVVNMSSVLPVRWGVINVRTYKKK